MVSGGSRAAGRRCGIMKAGGKPIEDREMQIRDYMKEAGVTLQELSAECHVSRATAARQLRGDVNSLNLGRWSSIVG